ncbi:MAG: PilW family protein [Gammaproteobacteria bacterium]|nr:PilW family protein [Gammaproteobacteria bacterium]
MKDTRNTSRHQTGLTLIEIMVAMVISLVLMAGVLQIFLANKKSFLVQESLSRMQENGRTAMRILADDLRMAGYWGCRSQDISITDNLDNGGTGYINLLGQGGLGGTNNAGLNSSDTVTLRGALSDGMRVTAPFMPTASSVLHVADASGLAKGDIMLVTNCEAGDLFQISNNNPSASNTLNHNTGGGTSPGNNTSSMSQQYQGGAMVYQVREATYSIQAGASGEPALFRSINGTSAVELVEGIEDLQIQFGELLDATNGAMRYVSPGTGSLKIDQVNSLRVTLIVRSESSNVSPKGASGDGRLRRTFNNTISIRNRNP